ncbi:hypothetical protein M8494_13455 [Serratia ureilytica]
MTFSEQEIKPVWDEVARLIGDGVMQLRHRGEALSVETLENIWRGSWRTATRYRTAHPARRRHQHAEGGK